MTKVTLVGELLAQKNIEFIFHGPLQNCHECKLTHICFNLKPYHRYKIIKVRRKQHPCSVHKGNVMVVEVEQLPILVALDKKHTKGSTIKINPISCENKLCPNYDYCKAYAIKSDQKYRIISTNLDIDCPKKNALQLVEVVE